MKSEPSVFSIVDLKRKKVAFWDGVRNYQVRNLFRDEMSPGDLAIFYNSSCDAVGAVGEMDILNPTVVDATQFKLGHRYYDPKSTKDAPRWLSPKVGFRTEFNKLVPLSKIKCNPSFNDSRLTQKGNRLSVVALSQAQYKWLVKQGK